MPMPAHLSVEGAKQGKFKGSCVIQGRADTILVQAMDHIVEIPKSPQTGQPTGKRIHMPLQVTAEVDKATPQVFTALCSGEQLKTVQLDFYRIDQNGSEKLYYTIKAENAICVSAHAWFPNALEAASAQLGHMIDYSFTYEKITWTWQDGGIECTDSWTAPK